MTQITTRRAAVAALAAAPLAGLPAPAGAGLPASAKALQLSPELADAIERHRILKAAFDAHCGPEDMPESLNAAETEALDDLALTPAASDAELLEKLRYLLAYESSLWGQPEFYGEFCTLAVALDLHFNSTQAA